jgi:hypothetical protein
MKAISIVIGLVLALMPMAFAQQPGGEGTAMGIEAALPMIGAAAGVGGIITSILGTLWAGFNDIDLTSYMFQATKIIAFACFEPLLYIWNLVGLCHVLPFVSWFMALCHAVPQLLLLCGNFFVGLVQHLAPVF